MELWGLNKPHPWSQDVIIEAQVIFDVFAECLRDENASGIWVRTFEEPVGYVVMSAFQQKKVESDFAYREKFIMIGYYTNRILLRGFITTQTESSVNRTRDEYPEDYKKALDTFDPVLLIKTIKKAHTYMATKLLTPPKYWRHSAGNELQTDFGWKSTWI